MKRIASELDFSRNYWSAVENDRTLIAEDKLIAVCSILELNETERVELLALRESARRRSWWDAYTDVLTPEMVRFVGLEDGATTIVNYTALVVPGLLQTAEYAQSIIDLDPMNGQLRTERLVEVRRRRQERLGADDLNYTALISEAALVQRWTPPDIHEAQIDYLITLVECEVIDLRVLPFDTAPGYIGGASSMVRMDFHAEHLPRIVWRESLPAGNMIEASADGNFRHLELCITDGLARGSKPAATVSLLQNAKDLMLD